MLHVTDFGPNPGSLDMYEYAPSDLPAGRPIVVVLHGCTQSAAAMENAGWNTLADSLQFSVVYPQQSSGIDCFDWYDTAEQGNDAPQARSIIAMIDHAVAQGGDRTRVYVTGLSAGAAYTAVLLATYPDRFAGASIMSGLPYKCAHDIASATSCQQDPGDRDWASLVPTQHPRVQIWQGDKDYTVAPANATALAQQWGDVDLHVVAGMGHAIAIGGADCPAKPGAYFEDHGICSTTIAAHFFGLDAEPASATDDGCAAGGAAGLLPALLVLANRRVGRRQRSPA